MNNLLKLEFAVILLLLLATVFIRFGGTGAAAAPTPPDTAPSTQAPADTVPETTEPSLPPETEPPLKLTFGADFSLEARDYFVYDCSQENMMAISGDPQERIWPASITKLFTAYVALQYLDPDQVITLGREVNLVSADSSLAYVKVGQTIPVSQLVEGMLLPSGNDAAYGLAVAAARAKTGNYGLDPEEALQRFVDMMNETAQAVGMAGSHFTNPDGYHDMDHYTCSADLVTIARLALDNSLIYKCVTTLEDRVPFSNGEVAVWNNTNHLIDPESQYYEPNAVGLKTGHTGYAGFCLLSAYELEGDTVIIGTFGCQRPEDRFIDALKLYDLVVEAKKG